MRGWAARLPRFARHVSGLSLGTILGQVMLLLASPFLTRIYTPDEFGSFSAMLGIATLLATLCALSYPVAIPLAKTGREASDLFWMTFSAGLVISPLATALVYLLTSSGSATPLSRGLWITSAITALAIAVWGGLRAIASRADLFRSVAASGVGDSGVQASGQIVLGQLAWGAPGLAGGYLAGKTAAIVVLIWGARRHLQAPHRPLAEAGRWIRYTVLVTPTTLLNQASVTAVSPWIAGLYGPALAGQFALAARMLAVPSVLVGQAIATVFFPKIARMTREGSPTLPAVLAVASALSSVAWPVFGATFLLGPELFSLAFGSEWREAGVAAAILSPWLALNLISSPISSVATVRDRLGQLLALGVLEASLRFGSLATGAAFNNWRLSLAMYAAVGAAISVYTLAWVLRLSQGSIMSWLASWPRSTWALLMALGTLAGLKHVIPMDLFVALSCLACFAGAIIGGRQLQTLLR